MSISSVGMTSCYRQQPTFDTTDTDGDGALSLDEFSAIGQNVPGGSNGLDSNSIQNLFSAIDTDGDGKISKTESKSAFEKLSSAVQSQLLGVQEQSGGLPSFSDIFNSADTDGSGGLSLDEFKAAAGKNVASQASAPDDSKLTKIFNAMDTNGDGTVSKDEMAAAHPHHHHAHMAPPPDQTATDASGTDQSATDPGSTTPDVSDLFQQAVSAYSSQSAATDIVDKLIAALTTA